MSREINTEKINIVPNLLVTKKLGEDEFVHVSAPSTGGLTVIEEVRFTDESGEKYSIMESHQPQGSVAMNTRDGSTVYEFSRKQ